MEDLERLSEENLYSGITGLSLSLSPCSALATSVVCGLEVPGGAGG